MRGEPRKLPVVLSADEVVQFLEAVSSLKSRAALTTAYAAGLRASEVAGLRIEDIDSARGVIQVRHGKGAKDRNVMLSPQLLGILRTYWRLARPRLYLFPGRDEDHPIDPDRVARRLPVGGEGRGPDQARHAAHAAPQLRDASSGERNRHPDHPGSARAQQSVVDGALHAGRHPYDPGDAEPARSPVAGGDATGMTTRPGCGLWPAPTSVRTGPPSRLPISCAGMARPIAVLHAGHLGRVERRVMSAIVACRTEALGGHVEACDDCGMTRIAYNSCRNRHCPKCQGAARAAWLAAREAELLPVPYFHVVFTLPAPIAAIAFQNKAVVYAILFKAAAEAMTTLAANPRRLGAEIGGVAVLHTWGQALTHHPHVHCVVPGGGLSPDGTRWIASRPNFFLAVKPLVPAVPPPVPRTPERGLQRRRLALLRRSCISCRSRRFRWRI